MARPPRDRPKLRALAENLNGKRVRVSGRLERVAGVEIRERLIIRVTTLQPG